MTELGIISGGNAFGFLFFEPLWGVLADKRMKKKILMFSCITAPLTTLSFTMIRGFWPLFFGRFVQGAIFVGGALASESMAASSYRKGRSFGLLSSTRGLTHLIGPALGGYLAEIDYMLPFYTSTIVSIVAAFLSVWVTEPRCVYEEKEQRKKRLIRLSKTELKDLTVLCFLTIFSHLLTAIFSSIVPVYAYESPDLSLTELEIGLMFTTSSLAAIPSQLLFGELSDRIGRSILITTGMAVDTLSFFLLPLVSDVHQLYLAAALHSIGGAAVSPLMLALLAESVSPSLYGIAIAFYSIGIDLGLALGPTVTGYIYQNYGPALSFNTFATLMAFGVVYAFVLLRKVEKHPTNHMESITTKKRCNK